MSLKIVKGMRARVQGLMVEYSRVADEAFKGVTLPDANDKRAMEARIRVGEANNIFSPFTTSLTVDFGREASKEGTGYMQTRKFMRETSFPAGLLPLIVVDAKVGGNGKQIMKAIKIAACWKAAWENSVEDIARALGDEAREIYNPAAVSKGIEPSLERAA